MWLEKTPKSTHHPLDDLSNLISAHCLTEWQLLEDTTYFPYLRASVLAVPTTWKAVSLLFLWPAPYHPLGFTLNVVSNKRQSQITLSKQVLPVSLSLALCLFPS